MIELIEALDPDDQRRSRSEIERQIATLKAKLARLEEGRGARHDRDGAAAANGRRKPPTTAALPKTKFEIKVPTNAELAANLKGHLLLVHGEIDNNVHPANTMRLVDALIKANKRFDMLIMPGARHGFGAAPAVLHAADVGLLRRAPARRPADRRRHQHARREAEVESVIGPVSFARAALIAPLVVFLGYIPLVIGQAVAGNQVLDRLAPAGEIHDVQLHHQMLARHRDDDARGIDADEAAEQAKQCDDHCQKEEKQTGHDRLSGHEPPEPAREPPRRGEIEAIDEAGVERHRHADHGQRDYPDQINRYANQQTETGVVGGGADRKADAECDSHNREDREGHDHRHEERPQPAHEMLREVIPVVLRMRDHLRVADERDRDAAR